jgi:hypothetical protein
MVYCAFVLPESLPKRRQLIAREKQAMEDLQCGGRAWWSAFDPRTLFKPLAIFYPTGPGSSRRLRVNMVLLALIDCTLFGVGMGAMAVIIMYAEKQFGWKNLEVSDEMLWSGNGADLLAVLNIPFRRECGPGDGAFPRTSSGGCFCPEG